MRKLLYISGLIILNISWTYAQSGNEFDFWVGNWDLTWEMANGATGKGVNIIEKTLDGKVIQENFEALDAGQISGFKGTSISVYNPRSKSWHQAWADNQGGYFDFIGEIDGDKRIFKTKAIERDGQTIISRMVFYEIEKDQFKWDWERTTDGGKTWNLQWRINYQRADND